jgi:pyridoxamine 5'-phosphate oxidase
MVLTVGAGKMRDGIGAERLELSQVLVAAFEVLRVGASDRRAAFHTPVFSSIGLDGAPASRIVVLRDFQSETRILRFHTDVRSAKYQELSSNSKASFTFYDQALKLQIRCSGSAALHHQDAIAASAWQGSQRMSRICYGTSPASGATIEDCDGFSLPDNDQAIAAGEENFCAVLTRFSTMEWLWLGHGGHRRAKFTWDEQGALEAAWLVP